MAELRGFCTFTVDGHLFGIDVQKIQEVLKYVEMTHVPLAPPVIGGLINLRGRLVTAIDLRLRLGFEPRPAGSLPMNIVLAADGGSVSLLVDETAGVLPIAEDAIEDPPASLKSPSRALIRGVFKLPEKLLILLDAEGVTDLTAEMAGCGRCSQ